MKAIIIGVMKPCMDDIIFFHPCMRIYPFKIWHFFHPGFMMFGDVYGVFILEKNKGIVFLFVKNLDQMATFTFGKKN